MASSAPFSSSASPLASRALEELKIRARLHRNARRDEHVPVSSSGTPRLRDWLRTVAQQAGFADWEHARRVLGGHARIGDDFGTFWHAPGCNALLNPWFARHAEAVSALHAHAGTVLLPYRRQFVLADRDYLAELGLEPDDMSWTRAGRDLAASHGSSAWDALAYARLRALTRA